MYALISLFLLLPLCLISPHFLFHILAIAAIHICNSPFEFLATRLAAFDKANGKGYWECALGVVDLAQIVDHIVWVDWGVGVRVHPQHVEALEHLTFHLFFLEVLEIESLVVQLLAAALDNLLLRRVHLVLDNPADDGDLLLLQAADADGDEPLRLQSWRRLEAVVHPELLARLRRRLEFGGIVRMLNRRYRGAGY